MSNYELALAKKNRCFIEKENSEKKGTLIVIEGNDGAGKSTLVKCLSKYLNSKGISNTVVKFNMSYVTLPAIKEGKKKYYGPITNTLLHIASLTDQFERYVIRELSRGKIVICDRYIFSIIVRALARGVDYEYISTLTKWMIQPDYVFYLDIHPEAAFERIGGENISFWEAGQDVTGIINREDSFLCFQSNVRNYFLKYMKEWDFIYLNSTDSMDINLNRVVTEIKMMV